MFKSKRKRKSDLVEIFDPQEVEQSHLTNADEEIKIVDIPERYQIRKIPLETADEYELEEEAKWIFSNFFTSSTVSNQEYVKESLVNINMFGLKARSFISKIKSILDLIRNRHYDLMFIANYRRELIAPEITSNDLFWILKYDEKWHQLRRKKESLLVLARRLQAHIYEFIRKKPDAMLNDDLRIVQNEEIQRIDEANCFDDLNDFSALLFLYYGQEMVEMRNISSDKETLPNISQNSMKKISSRRNYFSLCKKYGLNSLACKFGLTPEEFGENLRESYQVHEPEQFPVEPQEASVEYIRENTPFNTIDAVLCGARHIVALQLSHNPLIRSYFRNLFRQRGKIFIYPTNKGRHHITDWHFCAPYKYIHGKPLVDFNNDEFLLVLQAEEQGLITIQISLDESLTFHSKPEQINARVLQPGHSNLHTYFDEIKQLYLRDDYSAVVTKWNEQRTKALYLAIYKYIYPVISSELRYQLKSEAEMFVISQSMDKLYQWIDQAPWFSPLERTNNDHIGQDLVYHNENITVLACSIFPEPETADFIVALDKDGNINSYAKLNYTDANYNFKRTCNADLQERDFHVIKKLILSYKPKIVVLSSTVKNIVYIRDKIQNIIASLNNDSNNIGSIVEIMDPNLANVSSHTGKLASEFPDYPYQLRHAISMGRRAQDSLTEFASLAILPQNLLYLPVNHLQSRISQEDLSNALQFQICRAISNVGVDLNSCLKYEHKANLLSFVPGLGPRKASAILKRLHQDGSILENRSQLITICEIGPTVFLNCAAFIKIDVQDILEKGTDSYIEDLDGSRVHPETYDWAKKMAVDALEYDDTTEDFDSTEAVQRILRNPEKLRELDLDAFAIQLEKENFGDKRATLYDIRNELEVGCYKDRRKPYQRLNTKEIFDIIFDEPLAIPTQKTYIRGKVVICKVTHIVRTKPSQEQSTKISPERNEDTGKWACPFCKKADFQEFSLVWIHCDEGSCPGQAIGVRTILENGICGFIHIQNISSSSIIHPEHNIQVGMTITCRILSVNFQKFSLELSCKSSDLQDYEKKFRTLKDKFYDYNRDKDDSKDQLLSSKEKINNYIKRVLVHPKFKNISYTDSLPLLAKINIGDCLIRPSSRGNNRLTLSWKIDENIFQHIDVIEKNKPHPYSIGRSLWINSEEYEDLDEILAMYINRMSVFLKELRAHKYYRPPSTDNTHSLEILLANEKQSNPSRIPYFISPSVNVPGKFILAYTPKTKTLYDYISFNPRGLKFRGKLYDSLSQLLKWFKDHYVSSICERDTPASRPSPSIRLSYTNNRNNFDTRTINTYDISTHSKRYSSNAPEYQQCSTINPNSGNYSQYKNDFDNASRAPKRFPFDKVKYPLDQTKPS